MGRVIITTSWNNYLQYFDQEMVDTYFVEEYFSLYSSDLDIPECFIFEEDNKIFLFPYLKRQHSLFGENFLDFEIPYGYGGPIANTEDFGFCERAQKEFVNYCVSSNIIAGFARFHPLIANDKFFQHIGKVIFDRQTVAIDLTLDENSIWQNEIHSKHRNVIRKAESLGLTFQVDEDFSTLESFINLYNQTMTKVSAGEFYFFDNTYYAKFKRLIKDSFIGTVKYDEQIISAAIFFYSKNIGHYHLAGSDMSKLNLYPNNFLIYKAALHLKNHGVKALHLGGGFDSSPENPLFKFKSRFSKQRFDFKLGKAIFIADLYSKICNSWDLANPDKANSYRNFLLKYRY